MNPCGKEKRREKGIKLLDESLGSGFLPHRIHSAVKTSISAVKSLFNTGKVPGAKLTFISLYKIYLTFISLYIKYISLLYISLYIFTFISL